MSIVAVHGPQTFGSKAIYNSTKTFQAFAISGDGTKWRLIPKDQSQPAANYDWSWVHTSGTAGGTPASPLNNTMIAEFTFPAGSVKTITLTLNTVAQPTLALTIPAAGTGGLPSPMKTDEYVGEVTQEIPVTERPDAQSSEEVQVGYDPAAHTVAEVQEYVNEHPDQIDEIYDAEMVGKARSSLVSWLEEMIPFDPSDYTVGEVLEYAEANPEQLEDIVAAEQAGKNRSTLVNQLQSLRSG